MDSSGRKIIRPWSKYLAELTEKTSLVPMEENSTEYNLLEDLANIYLEVVEEYRILKPGDQLAVAGEMSGAPLYYHHGIFISHERGIIDYGGADKQSTSVRLVDLLPFTNYGKRTLARVIYPENGHLIKSLPAEEVVENAERYLKDPGQLGSYSVLENNCEHFATLCKLGSSISVQVLDVLEHRVPLAVGITGGAAMSSTSCQIS